MDSRIDNDYKTFTVTNLQLKHISKDILKEPRFDKVSTVDFLLKYLSKLYGCKVSLMLERD